MCIAFTRAYSIGGCGDKYPWILVIDAFRSSNHKEMDHNNHWHAPSSLVSIFHLLVRIVKCEIDVKPLHALCMLADLNLSHPRKWGYRCNEACTKFITNKSTYTHYYILIKRWPTRLGTNTIVFPFSKHVNFESSEWLETSYTYKRICVYALPQFHTPFLRSVPHTSEKKALWESSSCDKT